MEKRNARTRKLIWISIIVIAAFLISYYNIGLKVDYILWTEEIERYQTLNNRGLLVSILCSTVMFFTYILFKKYKISNIICLLALCVSIGTLGYTLLSMPNWDRIHAEQTAESRKESQTSSIAEISWKEVLDKLRDESFYLLYVGRDDCEACKTFKPVLGEILYENQIEALYYNTTPDREKSDFGQKINTLKVKSVPTLKIIGKNQVIDLKEEKINGTRVELMQYLQRINKEYLQSQ